MNIKMTDDNKLSRIRSRNRETDRMDIRVRGVRNWNTEHDPF